MLTDERKRYRVTDQNQYSKQHNYIFMPASMKKIPVLFLKE